jgi:hypothetical protein
MTPQEFIERQVVTTRYFRTESEMLVSMAGVAFQTNGGATGTLFNPNDHNISLMINADSRDAYQMVTYHCFVGLFAARIYKCLDKPWEIFRLHLNVYEPGVDPAANYGELIHEEEKGHKTARVYLEHLGPPIVPANIFVKALKDERLEQLIEMCPIKLTPNPRLYRIGMETHPHPGLLSAEDEVMAPYTLLPKLPKREYVV